MSAHDAHDQSASIPPPPPPPPPPTAYAAAPPTNGMATAGLVLGIASIFINTLFVPAILGVVFSSIGISRAGEHLRAKGFAVGRGAAIAGLICAIAGVLNSLLWKWILLFLI